MLKNKVFQHPVRYRPISANLLHRLLSYWPSLLVAGALQISATAAPDDARELEEVRNRIEDVKSDLESVRSESEHLLDELRQAEIEAGREALKLKEVEVLIEVKQSRLTDLNNVIAVHTQTLGKERNYLGNLLRAAYMTGRNDYLKLLLNQENPAQVGRLLAYYEHFNHARIRTINAVTTQLTTIREFQSTLQKETALLEELKTRQIEKSEKLALFRSSRQEIMRRLQRDLEEKGLQLRTLEEHERKLVALLEKLDTHRNTVAGFEDIPPFAGLVGKLQWPVPGRLLNTFGTSRRGASLKWDGVRIGAESGAEVRAVHTGRVIFADWFRNLGLLIILDHGEGYMSLYGYNQSLLKKTGDWVLSGETISYAGDSGGQEEPAVYFEIRHNGKPLDPARWVAR